jgi:DNA-3-methyladenine glycosylase
MKKLKKAFFNRKTELVAQELLGKILVYKNKNQIISGIIVETEAYIGPQDLANHASRGKTPRNEVMFDTAGHWYVYLIYGFYNCLNIVTENKDYPSAVLIRALEPLKGTTQMKINRKSENLENLTSGPGKLCQALGIDKKTNYSSAIKKDSLLFITDSKIIIPKNKIKKAKRIGVDYAGPWKNRLLRFYLKNNVFVSKK